MDIFDQKWIFSSEKWLFRWKWIENPKFWILVSIKMSITKKWIFWVEIIRIIFYCKVPWLVLKIQLLWNYRHKKKVDIWSKIIYFITFIIDFVTRWLSDEPKWWKWNFLNSLFKIITRVITLLKIFNYITRKRKTRKITIGFRWQFSDFGDTKVWKMSPL